MTKLGLVHGLIRGVPPANHGFPMPNCLPLLLFQLSPAPVKFIHLALRFFHLGVRGQKTRTVAGNPRVLQLLTFGLQ